MFVNYNIFPPIINENKDRDGVKLRYPLKESVARHETVSLPCDLDTRENKRTSIVGTQAPGPVAQAAALAYISA